MSFKVGDYVMRGHSIQKVLAANDYTATVLDLELGIEGQTNVSSLHKADPSDIVAWRKKEEIIKQREDKIRDEVV